MINGPKLLLIWRIAFFIWMNLAVLHGYKLKPNKCCKQEKTRISSVNVLEFSFLSFSLNFQGRCRFWGRTVNLFADNCQIVKHMLVFQKGTSLPIFLLSCVFNFNICDQMTFDVASEQLILSITFRTDLQRSLYY